MEKNARGVRPRRYLNAVKAAGNTDAEEVMAKLKKTKINDMFTKGGYIRADGVMIHDMYVMQVKTPQESKYTWDYYMVKVMSGEEALGPIAGLCALAPK
jgi:branched-chain amino acid transport system substrate-binding protein